MSAFNLLLLLHLVLGAWSAFLLTWEVTRQREPALVAGVVYGFSPYVLSFSLGSGVSETAFLFPLPLLLLFALRTIRRPGWANPLITALLLLLQGFAAWSYGIYAGLFLTLLLVALLLDRACNRLAPGAFATDERGLFGGVRLHRQLLARAALPLGAVAPALLLYVAISPTASGDGARYQRTLSPWPAAPLSLEPRPLPPGMPLFNAFSWIDYLLPGARELHTLVFIDKLTCTAYAGYAALVPQLHRMGFGHVVFRPSRLDPDVVPAMERLLSRCLGPARRLDGAQIFSVRGVRR